MATEEKEEKHPLGSVNAKGLSFILDAMKLRLEKQIFKPAGETIEEKIERLKVHSLIILGQEIKVSLPPIKYEKSSASAFITDDALKFGRVFLTIQDFSKFDYSDPTNEFRDHITVEVVDNTIPLRTCLFKGKKIKVHEGSDCMGNEMGKGEKTEFLNAERQRELLTHLEHKGLYIVLADPKYPDNGVYLKMLSKTQGVFQGQIIEVSSLTAATDFICIECRDKKT